MFTVIMITRQGYGEYTGYKMKFRGKTPPPIKVEEVHAQNEIGAYEKALVVKSDLCGKTAEITDSDGNRYEGEAPNFSRENVVGYLLFNSKRLVDARGFEKPSAVMFLEDCYEIFLYDWTITS